jgi:hypothetical protein
MLVVHLSCVNFERALYHVWEDGVEKETRWEFVDQQSPPHVAGVVWDRVLPERVPKCRRE